MDVSDPYRYEDINVAEIDVRTSVRLKRENVFFHERMTW